MTFSLSHKTVLITGGTAGIGLAVAKRFVSSGAKVVISGRRSDGDLISKAIGAHFVRADLSKDEDINNLFQHARQHLGHLDIVINNAGCSVAGALIAEQDIQQFDHLFALNVRAAYQVMQYAARELTNGGVIINTASIAADNGGAYTAAYNASKATLISLTKTAAIELASKGIRVNAVSPGLIDSEIWGRSLPVELAKKIVPLQRVGNPDEAAALYQFLASDEASYITGANYYVDGGYSAGAVMKENSS